MKEEDIELKVELLCRGARIEPEGWGAYKRSAGFQILLEDLSVSIPAWGKYRRYKYVESSPFKIGREDSKWILYRDDRKIREINVLPRPKFYDHMTSDGVEMWKVFHVCGNDCLLTGVRQTCSYMKGGGECKFCGTIFNPRYEGRLDRKTPTQLVEAAEAGIGESMNHIVLSSGVTKRGDRGVFEIAAAARAIKERIDVPIQAEVAVPEDVSTLKEFSDCIDSISINIETADQSVRAAVCPEKSKIPLEKYFEAFALSLELFGENQVNSWLIAGIGETDGSIIEGANMLAEAGVFPLLVSLRPTKWTSFENLKPPHPERLKTLSKNVADIVGEAGLKPRKNKAGCMRCGACSAVKDYANLR